METASYFEGGGSDKSSIAPSRPIYEIVYVADKEVS